MFHLILIFTIAIGAGLGASGKYSVNTEQSTTGGSMSLLEGTSGGGGSLLDGTAESAMDAVKDDWQPEDQTPTGKFTTAAEVKPILSMTKPNWVAVRDYDGKDLLYFTNLLAWRCGLHQISYGVNGAAEQPLEFEECHLETGQPNALTMETLMPFLTFDAGSIESLSVTVIYDDGTTDTATYQRSDILMP